MYVYVEDVKDNIVDVLVELGVVLLATSSFPFNVIGAECPDEPEVGATEPLGIIENSGEAPLLSFLKISCLAFETFSLLTAISRSRRLVSSNSSFALTSNRLIVSKSLSDAEICRILESWIVALDWNSVSVRDNDSFNAFFLLFEHRNFGLHRFFYVFDTWRFHLSNFKPKTLY